MTAWTDRIKLAGAALIALLAGSPALSVTAERSARERQTEAIMRDYMRMVYQQADIVGAQTRYNTPDFIQHNPEIASGVKGNKDFIEARGRRDPARFRPIAEWVNKVDHVMVDDKYFAIHHRLYTNPADPGRMFVDIWRTENGRIVEHWDIIQPIPPSAKNANAMWGDLAPARASAPSDPDPESVIRDYLRIGLENNDPAGAAEKYIADDFRQHSPHIADGKAALIAYFKAKPADPARYDRVSHILRDGDLVLVTRHTGSGPADRGTMYADLFRVRGGRIVEHWDVIQPIPETSVNGNAMW